jgi:hypothetical protein
LPDRPDPCAAQARLVPPLCSISTAEAPAASARRHQEQSMSAKEKFFDPAWPMHRFGAKIPAVQPAGQSRNTSEAKIAREPRAQQADDSAPPADEAYLAALAQQVDAEMRG